jgi:serine/threonine-protein kinase RsbW
MTRMTQDAEPRASAGPTLQETVVDVAVGPLARPVIGRVTGVMAAQAGLPLDRLSDATLLVEALVAHGSGHVPDGRLCVSFLVTPGSLRIRLGPLVPGGAEALLDEARLPGIGSVLERLADEIVVEAGDDGDHLTVVAAQSASS